MPKTNRREKPRDAGRRLRKKVSFLTSERIDYVDWKDADLLRRFLSERSKIRARRVTGNSAQQQKKVADAIKIAREMALVPYANRVTTQKGGRGDRGRFGRLDSPMPTPSLPPPSGSTDELDDESQDSFDYDSEYVGDDVGLGADQVDGEFEAETGPATETEAETGPETATEAEVGTETEAEMEAETEAEAEIETEAEVEGDNKSSAS